MCHGGRGRREAFSPPGKVFLNIPPDAARQNGPIAHVRNLWIIPHWSWSLSFVLIYRTAFFVKLKTLYYSELAYRWYIMVVWTGGGVFSKMREYEEKGRGASPEVRVKKKWKVLAASDPLANSIFEGGGGTQMGGWAHLWRTVTI